MDQALELVWSTAFLVAAVRLAIPVMAAGIGESISERAGLVNVGLDGMMLMGAFGSVCGAALLGNVWLGVLTGIGAGVLMAIPQGIVAINLAGDQIVAGLTVNLIARGVTSFFARRLFGFNLQPQVPHFSPIHVPFLSEIPVLGPVLFSQTLFAYIVVAAAIVLWVVLFKSRPGLFWRAAGEDPEALDSTGANVSAVRWPALLICGAMAGLGGTVIALGEVFTFVDDMTSGWGFIALALVIVARWSPLWAVAVAVLFGGADALALRVQGLGITLIPYQLSLMLPYILTLVAYALAARRGSAPKALGLPFFKT